MEKSDDFDYKKSTRKNHQTNKSLKQNLYTDDKLIIESSRIAQEIKLSVQEVLDRLNAGATFEDVTQNKKKARKRLQTDSESDEEPIEGVEHLKGLGRDKNGQWYVNIQTYEDLYNNATPGQQKRLDHKHNRGTDLDGQLHFNEKHRNYRDDYGEGDRKAVKR